MSKPVARPAAPRESRTSAQSSPREMKPVAPVPAHLDAGVGQTDPAALEAILGAAKGYRPLCNMLLDQIRRLVPSAEIVPVAGYVSFRAPAEFATLNVSASELRLGLGLDGRSFDTLAQKARLKGPGPRMTHMVVLNDARQVGRALDELILEARKASADEG
jgi:hypothetical protein